jgi:hypothetical protein
MLMQSENEFTIIAIKDDGEFHKLFTYMADIDALEADKAEVSKLADDYARQVNKTLKGVIVVSDGVVWFVTNVMDFTAISNHIRYILAPSSLAGRGLGEGFLFRV